MKTPQDLLTLMSINLYAAITALTRIIPPNSSFHQRLHPLSHHALLYRTEIMRPLRLMHNPKPISPWVHILIRYNFISNDIDISLDLSLLHPKKTSYISTPLSIK